jgi:hypothetical protein
MLAWAASGTALPARHSGQGGLSLSAASGNTSSHFGATVAFAALRYFALNATDHRSHREQNSMIRRYIAWRNRHTNDEELRAVSIRAKVA